MTKYDSIFVGNDNYGKPKQLFLEKLSKMDNQELLDETEQYIWLSAYAANNPRSDYHWKCNACYCECELRNRKDIYEQAFTMAKGSA